MTTDEFLTVFKQQHEPALLISDTVTEKDIDGVVPVQGDFASLFSSLQKGGIYAAPLVPDMNRETYDLIKQYTDRRDAVSVFSQGSWRQCGIDTDTRLLLVAAPESVRTCTYPIRQAVGMVFEDQ